MSGIAGVVVFASQKGGSGKTTLSGHIAVEAERAGAGPVALIDTDPQGSLAKWWNARAAAAPLFARVSIDKLASGIEQLKRSGVKLIVIDTPPAVTESIAAVVAHADLVVAPTRPSPHDLRAVGPTVDIVERARKPLVFVVNSATARARITAETAVALSQHGVVAPVTLHHRVDFAASMIDGRTVGEVRPDSNSAREITALWAYLRDRLARAGVQDIQAAAVDFATAALTPAAAYEVFEEEDELALDGTTGLAAMPVLRTTAPPSPSLSALPAPAAPAPSAEPSWQLSPAVAATLPPPPAAAEIIAVPPPVMPPALERAAAVAAEPVISVPGWDGVERRSADRGPPQGQLDRRKVMVFGRRTNGLRP